MNYALCRRLVALFLAASFSIASTAGPAEDADAAYGNGDYATALRLWRELAQQGNALSQAYLGYMYATGRGVAKDEAEAVKWYRMAAEQGNANGQNNLGAMYERGHGVPQDDQQAVDWYRKAAEQGFAAAQDNLAGMYASGRGVLRDDQQAVDWVRKAAEQGNASAQSNLGFMYRNGRGGLPQDDKQAVDWYRKAAEQGLATAQTNLGVMYRDGRGASQDHAEAERWFRKAAEQGDARAQTLLSSIEQGRRELADLSHTIAELVKANEKDLPATPVADDERARLAREIIDASGASATQINSPDRINEEFAARKTPPNMSPKLFQAIRVTAVASFRPDRILAFTERRLAETLDAATLQVGLQWERSDVGRHMHRLELETAKPEQRTAINEFARELVSKGGRTNEPRARACAQVDTLANQTDAMLPFLEAVTAGVMIGNAQQAPTTDLDGIRRAVVSARPLLREAARQTVLAQCLFTYRDLSDAEVEQWLEFLRSDSGGRYARGRNDALRDALLDVSEVFTRTLLEVARQIKGRGES